MHMYRLMSKSDKVITLVDRMRKNSGNQAVHKNVKLAKEALEILVSLDDTEEEPLGKAYACNAIIEQLPEYDVPRFVLIILRRELAWLEASDEKSDWLTPEEVRGDIERLEAYINEDGLSMREFCSKYGRHLLFDPIERSPLWEEIYLEVEEKCARKLRGEPRGMGFCFGYWAVKRGVLADYGIDWQSPQAMNPRVMFD